MKKLTEEKIQIIYWQKLWMKMVAIDRKRDRLIAKREEKKQAEKEKWVRVMHDQMKKDIIALKTWVRTLTPHEKAKQESTAYADACHLAQLDAKLRDTDNNWNWVCITCKEQKTRLDLEWWHCIAKGKSKATALDYRNINSQCSQCNAIWWWWGRYDVYQKEVDIKWWAGTHNDLLKIKLYRNKTNYKQFIQNIIPDIEMKLEYKKFDYPYKKVIAKMRKKYCSDI